MVLFSNINYTFDDIDYVKSLFVFLAIFIFFNSYFNLSTNNLIGLFIAGIFSWYYINSKVSNRLDEYSIQNNSLIELGLDRFPYLTRDIVIINILFDLVFLSRISRLDFYAVLKHMNHFFNMVSDLENTNTSPTDLYEIARNDLFLALNELNAFIPKLDPKRTLLNTDLNYTYDDDVYRKKILDGINEIRKRSQIYLDKMEIICNEKWISGDVNQFTKPIYPGQPEPSNLIGFDQNNFVIHHS